MSRKSKKIDSSDPPEFGTSPSDVSNLDLQHRFGAVSFVENRDESPEDEEQILSLDSLREAFQVLDSKEKTLDEMLPEAAAFSFTSSEPVSEELSDDEFPPMEDEWMEESFDEFEISENEGSEEENTIELSPRSIVEAMLFVGDRENKPLSAARAAEKMRNVSPEEVEAAIASLNRDYHRLGCPYTIVRERDGYRMVLQKEFEPILTKFYGKIREARLSQQAIDTLAVVAYRQPISAEEVQNLRKQPSSAILAQLVRRGLLGIEREIRDKKKILLYKTTDRFLELFGLESLDDLPTAEEIEFR